MITLEQVNEHPYLGIELNNNLCWGKHIDMITAKASKTLNMVRRNFYRSPAIIKKQAYTTLVRPALEYAASCWDPYEQSHINKLERIQNIATRFIKNDHRWTSSITKMKKGLKLQTLQERR